MIATVASPPAGAASDWTISQAWTSYSPSEHRVWDKLFARQIEMLKGRASAPFLNGLESLRLSRAGIPDFEELSDRLYKLTGWRVVAVPGLVPDEVFFEHLANRRFVAGRFIRKPEQLDYLQEPDVFHDVFGHVPLLSDPVFADYMQAYGLGGLRALQFRSLQKLARLYWYTVEFGLIREREGLRLYGAGILSSFSESVFALDSVSPNRIGFNLERVMRTQYRIDDYQQSYFVIDSFDELLHQTADADFAPIYDRLERLSDIAPDALLASDHTFNRGTQARAYKPDTESRAS
jgi:phenylalanine-4-hydroxylase